MNGIGDQTINCEFSPKVISYIYDEFTVTERSKFKSHLQSCQICTSELSEVSDTRNSIIEWRAKSFEKLSGPEIQLPFVYATRPLSPSRTTIYSRFVERLSIRTLAFAGSALLLLTAFGIGIFWARFVAFETPQVVSSPQPESNWIKFDDNESTSTPVMELAEDDGDAVNTKKAVEPSPEAVRAAKYQKAWSENRSVSSAVESNKHQKSILNSNTSAKNVDPPSLAIDLPEDNRSLRLSDLFDSDDMN